MKTTIREDLDRLADLVDAMRDLGEYDPDRLDEAAEVLDSMTRFETRDLPPLNEEEKEALDALVETFLNSQQDERVAIGAMRATLDLTKVPTDIAVVVAEYPSILLDERFGEEGSRVFPLAILATADVFAALTPPEGSTVEQEDVS